jgi:hypothetical protein
MMLEFAFALVELGYTTGSLGDVKYNSETQTATATIVYEDASTIDVELKRSPEGSWKKVKSTSGNIL